MTGGVLVAKLEREKKAREKYRKVGLMKARAKNLLLINLFEEDIGQHRLWFSE